MRFKQWMGWLVLATLIFSVGCLDKEVEEILYIEADGSLTWTILEYDVHSESDDPEKRKLEEFAYLDRAKRGEATAALALYRIGASDVQLQILRDRRPYSVRVEGRFEDPAAAFRGLFEACGMAAEATMKRDANGRHELHLRIDSEAIVDCGEDDESPLKSLMSGGEPRLALVSGQFVSADGFELEDEARIAVLQEEEVDENGDSSPRAEWTLVWNAAVK